MQDVFISDNKDIIIEMIKEPRLNLFSTYSEGYQYECTLRFKNNLGITLREIKCTEIDIFKLIDNIYVFLQLSEDMVYFFNTDTNCNNPGIMIRIEEVHIQNRIYLTQMFRLVSLDSNHLKQILSFDISDNLVEFIDKLYNLYIIDSNICDREYLSTTMVLNNDY